MNTRGMKAVMAAAVIVLLGISMAYAGPGVVDLPDVNGNPGQIKTYYANSPMPKGIISITVTNGGSGYVDPRVSFVDATGVGAKAKAVVSGGAVTEIVVTARGANYSGPTVVITDAAGSGAAATASVAPAGTNNNYGGIRKFVDSMPGLCALGQVSSLNGQCIASATPVTNQPAICDPAALPGAPNYCDYYELGITESSAWKMHSDLPKATKQRGYVDLNAAAQPYAYTYLGPAIIAHKDKPVRIKMKNDLPLMGAGGELPVPVDPTVLGAGSYEINFNPLTKEILASTVAGTFVENRTAIHLHGGLPAWVSDGTAHQWFTPAGETAAANYPVGVSFANVPDMADPGLGFQTLDWPNQQSARLMFFHDHVMGITRINPYIGMAAAYILRDPVEEDMETAGGAFAAVLPPLTRNVPLVIQDKTFVPEDIVAKDSTGSIVGGQDEKWTNPNWGAPGDYWFPHVYEPNQDITCMWGWDCMNPAGRWDYGPWIWPPTTVANPVLPEVSTTPEAFMDTMVVNGVAYPYFTVDQKAYRFRILSVGNDRHLNLQLYYATDANGAKCEGNAVSPSLCTEVAMVDPNGATYATPYGPVNVPNDWSWRGSQVPNPANAGPVMMQIGTEGGFLPKAVRMNNPPMPIKWDNDPKSMTVGNVLQVRDGGGTLILGPAERADVVIDFSQVPAGSTLILYNDAPAAFPAGDSRYDYYTGGPDMTDAGGAPPTVAGFGPNTRTIMQFRIQGGNSDPAFDFDALEAAMPAAFAAGQDTPIIAQPDYPVGHGYSATPHYARIFDFNLPGYPQYQFESKSISEEFDPNYGRINSMLGTEQWLINNQGQQTNGHVFIEPATEILNEGETQLWKITHNGVDTHAIHFHLVNVQIVNRVDWGGVVKAPDPNELGWKETVRMNPLEDIIVAVKAKSPSLPYSVPKSVRPLNPTTPVDLDPNQTTPPIETRDFIWGLWPYPVTVAGTSYTATAGDEWTVHNVMWDYGAEYTWHCHILGHEEFDMMRVLSMNFVNTLPGAPELSGSGIAGGLIDLTWTDATPAADPTTMGNSANEIGFRIERAEGSGTYAKIGSAPANATAYTDSTSQPDKLYRYRVVAYNASGDSPSNTIAFGLPELSVAPAALEFGNQLAGTVSAAQTVTVSNTGGSPLAITAISLGGTNPGQFGQMNNCPIGGSLASGAFCTVNVTFKPGWSGAKNALVNITVAAPAQSGSVSVSGTGVGQANSVSPSSLAFGDQLVGSTSAVQTVTVSNVGTTPMAITGISLGGTNPVQFAQTNNCPVGGSLAGGASCTIDVTFQPTISGTKTARVDVTVSAPAASKWVPLSGNAVAPINTVTPSSLAFGDQLVGTTSGVRTVTVTNTGTAPLGITGISLGGTNPVQFGQTNNCPVGGSLAPGASCAVDVTFKPTTSGAKTARVSITVDAPAASLSVPLSGNAIAPINTVTPASLAFGDQPVSTASAAQTVTVSNTGTAPLAITGISLGGTNPGQFAQTNNCPVGGSLAPGASCTVDVTFKPTSLGAKTARVSITVASPAASKTVPLSGTAL